MSENNQENKKIGINDIINCISYFLGSRLFFACITIFLGIRIIMAPSTSPSKIAFGIGIVLMIASVSVIAGFISSKAFNKSNIESIIEAILFAILGACMIIFSHFFGSILMQIICVIVIINSIVDIISLFSHNKLHIHIKKKSNTHNSKKEINDTINAVGENIREDFHRYNKEFVHAAHHITEFAKVSLVGQVILDALLIIAAVLVLLTEFAVMTPVFFVSGIIMVLTGINDIVLIYKEYSTQNNA